MTKKDWQEAGDQIRDLVQNAIDSGNYSELSNTITDVVNSAVDGVQDVLKNSLSDLGRQQVCGGWSKRPEDLAGAERKSDRYAQSHDTVRRRQEAAERIRKSMQGKGYHPVPRTKTPGLIAGKAMKWTGYSLGGMFAVTAGILAIVSGATGAELVLPMGIIDVFLVASVALGIKGSRQEGLAKRFRRYQQVIGERTFCLIEELSAAIGKKPKFVQKDLRKMIRDGFFPQGYLDKKETCLITDQQTYQQYLQTEKAYEARAQEAQADGRKAGAQQASASTAAPHGSEYQELLAEGQSYIRHIHTCNDKIEDPVISEKLDRMEMIVTRIFTEAGRNPDIADDLKKMMSYYLPTTKKLLDAYCELDEQPVPGENIETTKQEIAATLDTLNNAFAKLLDDLFEEKAWDISSDISVLNTMLAQEGLTEGAFDKK
ncbi:MAG: 5-bromo-4-chloroindolyl phosphate hydrolysis family protein [Lachnospiraceae bacterium]|nr:5-bromo-4-chloroindolyl phosphate hydrolysis family protein [Lachnospiraceae bacterium]